MKKLLFISMFLCTLLAILLSGCAGLGDYSIRLTDNYEIWRMSGWNRHLVLRASETGGDSIIDSYVDQVTYDSEYIFVQKREMDPQQSPPINEDSPLSYYIIVLNGGEVIGPLTEGEFSNWYSSLGRANELQWFDAGDEHALHDYWNSMHPGQTYE